MKIVIVGAPGSGKTWLAKYLEGELGTHHIEADDFFWRDGAEELPEKFRHSVREEISRDHWIFEGHVGKVFDLLVPHSPLAVVIQDNDPKHISRSMKKDVVALLTEPRRKKAIARIVHHLKFWGEMSRKRKYIIEEYADKFPHRMIYWDGEITHLDLLVKQLRRLKD